MNQNYGSFYGGPAGSSFIIVKSYTSVQQMTNDFNSSNRTTSNGVGFKEYVIINTTVEDSPDNGKIFRRGLNIYSSATVSYYNPSNQTTTQIPSRGAEYVGKLTGSIGSQTGNPAIIISEEAITDELKNSIQSGGVWFITEGAQVQESEQPEEEPEEG